MDEDQILVATLAAQSQSFLKSRINSRDGGSLNENKINWQKLNLQSPQQSHNSQYQPYPPPELDGSNVPSNMKFLPIPAINGQPVIQSEFTQSSFNPFPNNFQPLQIEEKIGKFELPAFGKGLIDGKNDTVEKLMNEIKILKKDIKKILKLLTDNVKIEKDETLTESSSESTN